MLGETIKYYRKKAGLTQAELGLYLYENEQTAHRVIRKFEGNSQEPKATQLFKLSLVFDVSMGPRSTRAVFDIRMVGRLRTLTFFVRPMKRLIIFSN